VIAVAKLNFVIRYAVYTRHSVDTLTDFSSCEAQFHTCQEFVRSLNKPTFQWCGQPRYVNIQLHASPPSQQPHAARR